LHINTQHYGVYTDDLDESLRFYKEVLGFDVLFLALADEAGIPLKMAWIHHEGGITIELIEQANYQASPAAQACRNHIALRTPSMDAAVSHLKDNGVVLETEPFAPSLEFDRTLENPSTFISSGTTSVQLRVAFFRGPSGERFELMQDNLGAAEVNQST
jgi:catechol 2,3-dioxygenase-like lactoylglutathione lyase family enzyme